MLQFPLVAQCGNYGSATRHRVVVHIVLKRGTPDGKESAMAFPSVVLMMRSIS